VGQTRKTVAERLQGHLFPGKQHESLPVYEWIRSLRPQQLIIVVLQEVEYEKIRKEGRYESSAAAAETKWMKRFERSRIFNSVNRNSGAYRRLVNPND
jgi:hypothetical protein